MQATMEKRSVGDPAVNFAASPSRVQQILGWYGSDNPGTLTNLARLLNHGRLAGTGKVVILPVDQGFEHGPARSFGPNPPAYDPRYHFELAIEAGCNAYAAPLGFLEAGARDFAGQIPLILKVNDHDVLNDEKDPFQALTGSVHDALNLAAWASASPSIPLLPIGWRCTARFVVMLKKRRRRVWRLSFGPTLEDRA